MDACFNGYMNGTNGTRRPGGCVFLWILRCGHGNRLPGWLQSNMLGLLGCDINDLLLYSILTISNRFRPHSLTCRFIFENFHPNFRVVLEATS
jgi:hypothetical protein